jgi:anti-sigma B factor antagonist
MIIIPEQIDHCAVLRVKSKRIDAAGALQFKNTVNGVIDGGSRDVVLDLSEVDFVDSSGLGAIVAVLKHIGQHGSLAISGATPTVERLFKMTRMDKVFRLFPDVKSALLPVAASA